MGSGTGRQRVATFSHGWLGLFGFCCSVVTPLRENTAVLPTAKSPHPQALGPSLVVLGQCPSSLAGHRIFFTIHPSVSLSPVLPLRAQEYGNHLLWFGSLQSSQWSDLTLQDSIHTEGPGSLPWLVLEWTRSSLCVPGEFFKNGGCCVCT